MALRMMELAGREVSLTTSLAVLIQYSESVSDRQTDGRTERLTPADSKTSRGKNEAQNIFKRLQVFS